ncbi:MAG: amidohydrolase [Spirochaetota bacterium]
MVNLLIEHATIVTVNKTREILYEAALAIKDNVIVDLGSSDLIAAKYGEAGRTIDGTGKIIFPGLINTHTHLFQTLLKGLGDDMALDDWVAKMTFPAAIHLTQEDVYGAAMLGCAEALHSGTTTMLDYMYPHPRPGLSDSIIKAFMDLKLRGILARGMMNTGERYGTPEEIMQDVDTIEKDCRRLLSKYHQKEQGRIRIWLAPAAVWSNSEECLKKTWEIAEEYKTGFTIHISETPFDRRASQEMHGLPDAEVLEKLNILGPNVLMVHCVYLTEKDMKTAGTHGLKISHNPVSNMYLASGIAPVPEMIENGLTVSLGTDGAASNNTQDMIETLKVASLLHKVNTLDPIAITAEKVLEMATINGAEALGLEAEIGSLEVGKKADFFIYNPYLSAKSTPMHNPVSTLVYSGSSSSVETVVVDGNIVLDGGKLTGVDEKEIIRSAQGMAVKLAERSGVYKANVKKHWH